MCLTPTVGESTESSLWAVLRTWLGIQKWWQGLESNVCPLMKPAVEMEGRLWMPPWWALEVKATKEESPLPQKKLATSLAFFLTGSELSPGSPKYSFLYNGLTLIGFFGVWVFKKKNVFIQGKLHHPHRQQMENGVGCSRRFLTVASHSQRETLAPWARVPTVWAGDRTEPSGSLQPLSDVHVRQ